jgi:hypothetical protein
MPDERPSFLHASAVQSRINVTWQALKAAVIEAESGCSYAIFEDCASTRACNFPALSFST